MNTTPDSTLVLEENSLAADAEGICAAEPSDDALETDYYDNVACTD